MRERIKRNLFPLTIFLLTCTKKPPIDFYQEEVRIKILPGKVSVFGQYFLKNLKKERIRAELFYPFPLD
ncbi:MAG: hypothetical protein ABIK81_03870, partial [candidate division WOR-3 bacterium]